MYFCNPNLDTEEEFNKRLEAQKIVCMYHWVELIAEEINELLDKSKKPGQRKSAGLLITHLGYILNYVNADIAHVLMDGEIACSGNPEEIIEDIKVEGFKGCVECAGCITKSS